MSGAPQRLTSRVARRLAFQAFSQKYKLELGMFGPAAARRREIWVEKNWTAFVDDARDVLADIAPEVLALTYRDEGAARERYEMSADPVGSTFAAVEIAIACHSNSLGDRLAVLFDAPPTHGIIDASLPVPPEPLACSRS